MRKKSGSKIAKGVANASRQAALLHFLIILIIDIMLPEKNEWQVLRAQFTEKAGEEHERELALDEAYISFLDQSVLKGDGEDHKRMLLLNFDVRAHQELLRELIMEEQYASSRVIQWYLDEYARLFPGM